ncbi:EAL domain-containing protein [Arcobacter roscoffensis]|uniref:EAL domain-containing protein n=1 Tax=Arcobacter roscoffensis TaxID=2961520 RepID=A0ABY5E864_9BACT|nr:EAL domain-containing protein [Arcobacter roscoffensis]UTJ06941.1 EAL domain-containing protein [Arcobacter roscoffensis]
MFKNSQFNELIENARDIKVLYAEDEHLTRDAIEKLLNIIFEEVIVAKDGENALELFEKHKDIDLLITDINMPKLNGIELLKILKEKNPNLATIIVSAHSESKFMLEAIKLNVDNFILKPFEAQQLFEVVKKAIEKTSLKRQNERNLLILKQYQEITNKSSIISKTDASGVITFVNENFCEISGYSKEELIGNNHNVVRHPDNPKELFKELWHTIKIKKEPWSGIIKNLAKDGKSYFVKSTIKPLLDQNNEVIEYMALRNDVTEIMSEKKQLVASLESYENSFLALIQIENFDILDKFYDTATVYKIEEIFEDLIVSLFQKNCKVYEKIFKLGDGLFAISNSMKNIEKHNINIELELLTLIKNTKNSTIKFENIEYDVSIAISYCFGEKNVYENAKYGIEKALEDNKSMVFANNLVEEAQERAQKNIETIHMVKKALDNYNIVSYFQPIIDNKTKEIAKYESLVRLIDENGNTISPYFFLDVSKKGTYYTKITNRVIESSFKVLDHIENSVSINLSVLDMENEDIKNKLIELTSKPEYKGRVIFELLENENIKDFESVKDFIAKVKKLGDVKIAIDDFGSGYSNFERLLEYTPDILKIDGSLIKNIETDPYSRNVVETIVTFAKKQKIETIAEFVENESIYNILNEMGVTYSQGYYFGKPEKLL